jgi:hypothetical protein
MKFVKEGLYEHPPASIMRGFYPPIPYKASLNGFNIIYKSSRQGRAVEGDAVEA